MPIMTRMRDSMPTILFGLLIAFLITIVFEWGMDYTGISARGADVVGTIDGKEITYREFSDQLRDLTETQRLQTGNDLTDDQLRRARDQVWQSIVNRELLSREIERMGIRVSDQEIIDWVHGENPPEDLRQNFIDSTGQFRRDIYEEFLADPNQFIPDPEGRNPRYGEKWLADYEQFLRERRAQEKLQSLVTASIMVTEGELLQDFTEKNRNYEYDFVLLDANKLIPDSAVTITDEDLREYYNEHLDQQKIEASRDIKYIFIPERPSEADSADARGIIEDIIRRAGGGEDFIDLVFFYDETPDSGSYFNRGEMTPALEEAAFSASVGDMVGPILERDGYHAIKVLDRRSVPAKLIWASHILLRVEASGDTSAVKSTAANVARRARSGEDFSALAREFSEDPGSAERGGDLGWFGRGRMVKKFEDAAFGAKPGQIVGPVRTAFGWHIIKVHEIGNSEVSVADIRIPIEASSQTESQIFDLAAGFAYNARENDFFKEVESLGFTANDATVREKGNAIPGIGVSDAAVQWVFDEGIGDVSEPFRINNGYAVLTIVGIKDAGFRPFEEAKDLIRNPTLRTKKITHAVELAKGYRSQLGEGDRLNKLEEIDPDITVQHVDMLPITGNVPGVGRDPALAGVVSGLHPGQISEAIRGTRGAFIVELLSIEPLDSAAFDAQKEDLRETMLRDRRNRYFSEWLAKLQETADIEDNRGIFFR